MINRGGEAGEGAGAEAGAAAGAGWRTERLAFRPQREDDAEALFAALDDPRVGAFIGGPVAGSVDELRATIRRHDEGPPADRPGERWWNFTVADAASGVVMGGLQATVRPDWAEVAYAFGPRWWGRGYASEGLAWLLGRLAAEDVHESWASVHPENLASQRLLLRCGFVVTDTRWRPVSSYEDGDVTFVRVPAADPPDPPR